MKSQKCVEYTSVQNGYNARGLITLMICAVFLLLPQAKVWADEDAGLSGNNFENVNDFMNGTDAETNNAIDRDSGGSQAVSCVGPSGPSPTMENAVKNKLQELKNNGTPSLSKFAICAESSRGAVYGCNVNSQMKLMSLTKLEYADWIYKNSKTEVPIDAGACKTDKNEIMLFGGDHPDVSLGEFISGLGLKRPPNGYCYKKDLEFRPSACIDSYDQQDYYEKLANNPTNGDYKKNVRRCIQDELDGKGMSACEGTCELGLDHHYKVEQVLHHILVKSDSYAVLKLGNNKVLNPHWKHRVDGADRNTGTCADLLKLNILSNCNAEELPSEADTGSTWHSYYSKLKTSSQVRGKTGSSAVGNIINFAGCTRNSSEITRVAMMFDFDGDSGTQENLGHLRSKVYDAFFKELVKGAPSATKVAHRLGAVESSESVASGSSVSSDKKPGRPSKGEISLEKKPTENGCQLFSLPNKPHKEDCPLPANVKIPPNIRSSGEIFMNYVSEYSVCRYYVEGVLPTSSQCHTFQKWLNPRQ